MNGKRKTTQLSKRRGIWGSGGFRDDEMLENYDQPTHQLLLVIGSFKLLSQILVKTSFRKLGASSPV